MRLSCDEGPPASAQAAVYAFSIVARSSFFIGRNAAVTASTFARTFIRPAMPDARCGRAASSKGERRCRMVRYRTVIRPTVAAGAPSIAGAGSEASYTVTRTS